MPEIDTIDEELRGFDQDLAAAATPDPAALSRVRERVRRGIPADRQTSARTWSVRGIPAWAVAAVVVVGIVAGALGSAAMARVAGPGPGLATTVIPPSGALQGAATPAGADFSALGGAGQGQAAAAGPVATSGFVGGPCATAPTVQFQGRGLAATGIAPIAIDGSETVTNLWVSVNERGTDAAIVVGSAQAKVAAVKAALEKAGVPAGSIQQPYFSSYGDSASKQFWANASIQAQVSSADLLAAATSAVLQVPGVQGYSTSTALGGQPTAAQVQAAVGVAASQARDMAAATAKAAGVALGSVESVVSQPPSVCYGGGTPTRVVQVTISYAIK